MNENAEQAKHNDVALMAYCIASEVLMGENPEEAELKHQEATNILEEMARNEIPFPVFKRINFTLEGILASLEETQTALCLYDGLKSFFTPGRDGKTPSVLPEETGRCQALKEAANREAAELKTLIQPKFRPCIDRYLAAALAEQTCRIDCFRDLLYNRLKDLCDFAQDARLEP